MRSVLVCFLLICIQVSSQSDFDCDEALTKCAPLNKTVQTQDEYHFNLYNFLAIRKVSPNAATKRKQQKQRGIIVSGNKLTPRRRPVKQRPAKQPRLGLGTIEGSAPVSNVSSIVHVPMDAWEISRLSETLNAVLYVRSKSIFSQTRNTNTFIDQTTYTSQMMEERISWRTKRSVEMRRDQSTPRVTRWMNDAKKSVSMAQNFTQILEDSKRVMLQVLTQMRGHEVYYMGRENIRKTLESFSADFRVILKNMEQVNTIISPVVINLDAGLQLIAYKTEDDAETMRFEHQFKGASRKPDPFGTPEVFIGCYDGGYLFSNGDVTCRESGTDETKKRLVPLKNNKVALYISEGNNYCSVVKQQNYKLKCGSKNYEDAEAFDQIRNADGTVSLKCTNKKYLRNPGGNNPLVCNGEVVESQEKFKIQQIQTTTRQSPANSK
ncbi:hypothetical protein M3Y97_01048900 [Aphelenchoides bicaudatus]|nr:hypothetical protein M3Y97_01048900 [Aphelenchoides bicaudatus]